ncbi:hypothetical protein FQN55_008472 [Onygenales sp. PD_40]|nr:hypothetical protein FQN55_008472 [Onygenales sp. PD_40]
MAETNDASEQLKQAKELFKEGNTEGAFKAVKRVLQYPGTGVSETGVFVEALDAFAPISQQLGGDSNIAELVHDAAAEPDNVDSLYELGNEMIKCQLQSMAATVLARAQALAPDEEPVTSTLAVALEKEMRHKDACRVLEASTELIKTDFICCYLLALNSIMVGKLDRVRELLPVLRQLCGEDDTYEVLPRRMEAMLERASSVEGVTTLDQHDLRGWHYVLSGGLLLSLAVAGFDDPMHGRFCFIYDNESVCLESIRRLKLVLDQANITPPRVFCVQEHKSALLAKALAETLGCELVAWPENGSREPGIIAIYDSEDIDYTTYDTMQERPAGQILWTHALKWTRTHTVAPDVVSYLSQFNYSPWHRSPPSVKDGKVADQTEADDPATVHPDVLVQRILEAHVEGAGSYFIGDTDKLLEFARVTALCPHSSTPGAPCVSGKRGIMFAGSPVPSNRFN